MTGQNKKKSALDKSDIFSEDGDWSAILEPPASNHIPGWG